MKDYIQVITTTSKKRDAENLARALLKERLAGCVQIIGPIDSRFRWKGRLEKSQEWLCVIKSRKALYGKLQDCIKINHPYGVPEIIATTITAGSRDYLEWLDDQLTPR